MDAPSLSLPAHALTLQPNPVADVLQITFEAGVSAGASLVLLDAHGRVVQQWSIPMASPGTAHLIDMKTWPAGIYWLQLTDRQTVGMWKLVKV
ncbi:MAG: T9SS type A sorting domain-containing protein [Saprospiraceae bacterium]